MAKTLSAGARQLPLRHISIRVPWNDTGWDGRICNKPGENIACLILPRIRALRKDEAENGLAGATWQNLPQTNLPPCVAEHGHFMAPYEITRLLTHPYAENSKAHQHLLPTPYRHAPFSAAAIPFKWMLRESAEQKAKELELGYQPDLEAHADQLMGYKTSWVQDKVNQLVMLDTFLSAIHPEESLIFFYAKRTPLSEDARRVIIGVGRVNGVGDPVEYKYSEPGPLQSILWERNIHHSIRNDFKDGFLLPYQSILEYLKSHPEEDPVNYLAFVPDDQFQAFSFGSEHVTNDGAIGSILSCISALQNIQKVIPGPWQHVLTWLDDRLNELWHMRGPCPGLGSTLSAFGVENGSLVAYELERMLLERPENAESDPWLLVDALFTHPEQFKSEIGRKIGKTLQNTWHNLPPQRMALLKLLSRFEVTSEQAIRYYVHEDKQRSEFGINLGDAELIANPYRLFETDRFTPDPINIHTVDRGLFPDVSIQEKFPLPEPSRLTDALDPRRVAAFVIHQLDLASLIGHTLQTRDQIIQQIRDFDVKPACPITGDHMSAIEQTFEPRIRMVKLHNDVPAYQLDHLSRYGEKIRSAVVRRLAGTRHLKSINWALLLDQAINIPVDPSDQSEIDARKEKTAALDELYSSRFSVLIGPAGTGKTTLLKVLCQELSIKSGGILMLAPTGKARVRMETQTGISGAQTIAQFLIGLDRYEPKAGYYHLSEKVQAVSKYKTVIIDESSMLNEDQLAAVLDALQGVERLILVGDPRQLPPIGAGRPFLDIVQKLVPNNVDALFPRVGQGYAELTIRRRQVGQTRDDLLFAEWFSGRPLDPGADEIWEKIEEGNLSDHLRFVRWDNPDQLQELLLNVLAQELKLIDKTDTKKFEISIGGTEYNDTVYFWASRPGQPGACAKVESWQILSPVHNNPFGVEALNRLIQGTFRSKMKERALSKPYYRKIPSPMGREEILYGDKVIQTKNQRRYKVYPDSGALQYVANGEMGIAVGQYKTKNVTFVPYALEVEFSSQPGYKYTYYGSEFGDEGNPVLELAYALTVHKTQGSEFGITFVVIPNPCKLLSRELLYTALTRQRDKTIILHQGPLHEIKNFSQDQFSESAARLTNIFSIPNPVLVQERFLENQLIHRTGKGLCVRSKSEVIIASELDHANIDYVYDSKFVGQDGSVRYPDFVIDDSETGKRYYWEHLGMLNKSDYKKRWEKKLLWYERQGILPIEKGGGPYGTLITTLDHPDGGIDVAEITRMIQIIKE